MPLRGTFNLSALDRDAVRAIRERNNPRIEYTIGRGETLDELFDFFVADPAIRNDSSVKDLFKGRSGDINRHLRNEDHLEGKKLYLDVGWLRNNRHLPNGVRANVFAILGEE